MSDKDYILPSILADDATKVLEAVRRKFMDARTAGLRAYGDSPGAFLTLADSANGILCVMIDMLKREAENQARQEAECAHRAG